MAALKKYTLIWGVPEENFIKEHAKDKDILIAEMRPGMCGALYLCKKFKNATLVSDNMLGFLFANKAIKEVKLFFQDRDSFGYTLIPGSFYLVILAKRHNVLLAMEKGERHPEFVAKDRNALSFLGKSTTAAGVLPIALEHEFGEYKFIEGQFHD